MGLKTMRVLEFCETLNWQIAHSKSREIRKELAYILASALHKSHNYSGFSYLPEAGVKNPCTPQLTIADDSYVVYDLSKIPR
jgi:hypothetical protein